MRFFLVGGSEAHEHGFRETLQQLALAPSLEGRVTFTGHRDDVGACMRAMDVVVLSSRYHETLGMVLLEAMAVGRQAIGARVGGVPEVLTSGSPGLLVPANDDEALAAAMTEMLRRGPLDERIGRDFVLRNFSPDVFCARVAAIYDDALSVGPHASAGAAW